MSRVHISKCKRSFIAKSSLYYFHMKRKILTDFQICISVPLAENVIFVQSVCEISIVTRQQFSKNKQFQNTVTST